MVPNVNITANIQAMQGGVSVFFHNKYRISTHKLYLSIYISTNDKRLLFLSLVCVIPEHYNSEIYHDKKVH